MKDHYHVKLHEIPENGKEFVFNRKTAELNLILKDLIEDSNYEVTVFIKPMNTKNYEVKGTATASSTQLCSTCGDNFEFKSKAYISEILIPGAEDIKNSHFSKSNHVSELNQDGPGVSEYFADTFDLGEFLHEAIAFTIPFNPKHDAKDSACTVKFKSDENGFIYDEKMSEEKKPNAFDVLKGIKLN